MFTDELDVDYTNLRQTIRRDRVMPEATALSQLQSLECTD